MYVIRCCRYLKITHTHYPKNNFLKYKYLDFFSYATYKTKPLCLLEIAFLFLNYFPCHHHPTRNLTFTALLKLNNLL
jgi:hypothetical protein